MTKYLVVHEEWRTSGISKHYNPTREDFFEYATDNPNGADFEECIHTSDTKEEALAELSKYRCTYERWDDYQEAHYDLYAVVEVRYDVTDEYDDYRLVQYAEIEM